MNLKNKKKLAAKVLKTGKNRIRFNPEFISEIKEAITKQDVKSLNEEGMITIKPVKGRKKIKKRRTKRGPGKIKKKIKKRKQNYVKITRKLRAYLKMLKKNKAISDELYRGLRKKIKMKAFKDTGHFKAYIEDFGIEIKKHPGKKSKKEGGKK